MIDQGVHMNLGILNVLGMQMLLKRNFCYYIIAKGCISYLFNIKCCNIFFSVCLMWVVRGMRDANGSNASMMSRPLSLSPPVVATTWFYEKIQVRTVCGNP